MFVVFVRHGLLVAFPYKQLVHSGILQSKRRLGKIPMLARVRILFGDTCPRRWCHLRNSADASCGITSSSSSTTLGAVELSGPLRSKSVVTGDSLCWGISGSSHSGSCVSAFIAVGAVGEEAGIERDRLWFIIIDFAFGAERFEVGETRGCVYSPDVRLANVQRDGQRVLPLIPL